MKQNLFRAVWRAVNIALLVSLLALVYSAGWEHVVRDYLDGFGDAIIPSNATPEQRVEAILQWMRRGTPRSADLNPTGLAVRDPETTLNYQQLLSVCGIFALATATFAAFFLLLLRLFLAWYADHREMPRFHLRSHLARARVALFTMPEIK